MKEKEGNMKQMAMGMAAYTSASILGPLLIFGGIGMFLDNIFGKKSLYTIIGLAFAFFITNIILFRKMKKLSAIMTEYSAEITKKKEEERKRDNNQETKIKQ